MTRAGERRTTDADTRQETQGVSLGPGHEFDLIGKMRERWGPLAVGIGDDAAVIRPPRGEQLVVSTDSAVEFVHFKRDWFTLQEIGYRAVTAALSDLAAMAAAPLGVLVAILVPPDDTEAQLLLLADGVKAALASANTVIIGGNLARAKTLSLTTTVAGSVFSPLTRAEARPGDLLYVTGQLGGPRAALRALQSGAKPSRDLMARLTAPRARIAEARWLATRGAIAAIDISDGLAADAGHLAAASNVRLDIQVERVPVFPEATEDDALAGGEEYELFISARAPLPETEFAARFGIPLTLVGRATPPRHPEPLTRHPERSEGSAVVRGRLREGSAVSGVSFTRNGTPVTPPPGYDHFR